MYFHSNDSRYVSKKMLPLCITLALLNGGITAFAADTAKTVDGSVNGAEITGSTNFNQITVIDNTSAVVEDANGKVTTITNSKDSGWDTILGANDQNATSTVYEIMGGNIINVASDDTITIHNLIGGSSRYEGDPSIRSESIVNNVINIGNDRQSTGTLRADVITGGLTSDSSTNVFYAKAYPFYNALNLSGMTITGTSDTSRVKIYGGAIGLSNSTIQGKVFSNIINIQDSVVLKNADVYGGQTNVTSWGGHVMGNRINLSGDADLSQDVTLHGAKITPSGNSDMRNYDNILNVGYQEEVSYSDKKLPNSSFLNFNSPTISNAYPIPANDNYYLNLTGKVTPWKNNEVKEISEFSSVKIWAMNDFDTPALKLQTGNFVYDATNRTSNTVKRGTIIDLTYLTSGKDYGAKYIDNSTGDDAGFDEKVEDIDLRELSDEEKSRIFFAGAAPDAKITVIQAENGIYQSEDQVKANKLTYGYSLQQDEASLTGSYTGDAGIDGNNVVWRTGDITVSSMTVPNVTYDASGPSSTPLQLEKYGYVFNENTAINNPNVTNTTDILISPDDTWTLVDGSAASSVTSLENLSHRENEVTYDMSGGAVTVTGKGATGISSDGKSFTYHLDNPTILTYHNLDWASSNPVSSLDSNKNYDLSGTTVDWSNLTMNNLSSLRGGINERTLLDTHNTDVGLTDDNLVGTTQNIISGTTLEGTGQALVKDGNVIYSADMHAQAQTHRVLLGQESSLAAILETNDLILDTMKTLDQSKDGVETFAAIGGGENRYETGSHITTNIWRGLAGAALKHTMDDGAQSEYGVFYDYGNGNYRTYDDYGLGNGKINYKGAGIFGKRIGANGTYGEASLRIGRASNEAKNLLHDANGQVYSYETNSMYNAFHAGVGRIFDRGNENSLDTYLRFFHTHLNGDNFNAGGQYDIDSLESNVVRIGTRWQHKDNRFTYYTGLAYEYEFSGNAYGLADGAHIESASTRGGSVRFEYGLSVDSGDWNVSLNGSAYAGSRRGFNGNISLARYIW